MEHRENVVLDNHPVMPLYVSVSSAPFFYSVRFSKASTVFSMVDFPDAAIIWYFVKAASPRA